MKPDAVPSAFNLLFQFSPYVVEDSVVHSIQILNIEAREWVAAIDVIRKQAVPGVVAHHHTFEL